MTSADGNLNAPMPMPNWARALIIVFFIGLAVTVVGICAGSAWLARFQQDVRDPVRVAQIAKNTLHIDALPNGLEYEMGYAFEPISMIGIADKSQTNTFTMMVLKNERKLEQRGLESLLSNEPLQPIGDYQIAGHGDMPVAGGQMIYEIVKATAAPDKLQQLRGAMLIQNGTRVLRFTGTTQGKDYNMDLTKQLLDAIKGPL